MNRMIVTELKSHPGRVFYGLWENDRPAELSLLEKKPKFLLGDIWMGRVRDVMPGIHAAFVQLTRDEVAYLPLEEAPEHIRAGSIFPVQVTREAQKTKDLSVTTQLSLAGRLAVLITDHGAGRILVSGKITDEAWKTRAKEKLEPLLDPEGGSSPYGFVLRTNAYREDLDAVFREAEGLLEEYRTLIQTGETRLPFRLLRRSDPVWLARLLNISSRENTEIVTDLPKAYAEVETYLREKNLTDRFTVRFYEDSYPLPDLYGLEKVLQEATARRVWLKSGGYLIIEPTEAMTVIDVNSGKAQGKREKEENILRLNLEAAEECAHQMRLRNLSGMILIDFIDMKEEAHRTKLIRSLAELVRSDPVPTSVVDMTKLGIIECTRKKIARPLLEQLASAKGTEQESDEEPNR